MIECDCSERVIASDFSEQRERDCSEQEESDFAPDHLDDTVNSDQ